ncbi:MAG: hypothetical protein HZC55_16865 [Verrucomicrobia bacterium]|nr:hypothetical protein [Verrucomicrobiota bacterium]
MTEKTPPSDPRSLRRFALQLGAVLLLLLAVLDWRGLVPARGAAVAAIAVAVGVAIGLVQPGLVRPVHAASFAFSRWMGKYVGGAVLTVFFLGVVTPLGWLLRCFGHDPLALRARAGTRSYWHQAKPPGPMNRMF